MKYTKYIKLFSFVAVALLFTQSCLVTKEYQRPEELVDENLYRNEVFTTDSSNIATQAWRTYFKDPVLIQHIETGLENNNDYRIATQQILNAEANLKQAKAGYQPNINTQAAWHKAVDGNAADYYDLSANISWEIDVWGKITSQKNAAIADFMMTKENQQAVKSMLVARIAGSYLKLLSLDEQLRKKPSNYEKSIYEL